MLTAADMVGMCTAVLCCSVLCLVLREFNAKTAEYKDVPLRVLIKVSVESLLQPVVAIRDVV